MRQQIVQRVRELYAVVAKVPPAVSALIVASLLVAAWWVTYAGGGTQSAWPHLFYVPILVAAVPFGVAGGLLVALAATLLCGPLMPLDTATAQPQALVNWVTRGVFFTGVGVLASSNAWFVRAQVQIQLRERLAAEMAHASPVAETSPDGIDWAAVINDILERGAVTPVFQPIFALDDGRVVAVEALARFDSPVDQPPNIWFDRAAVLGLDLELERAAVEAAFAEAHALPDDVDININASPHMLADPWLLDILDAHRQLNVTVEVTEHVVIGDYRALAAVRADLRQRGVKLAVDDAGAGFASLQHIVQLEPDTIKLDPSLTRGVRRDPILRPLAEALLQFAQQTSTAVVVEGIEHRDDLFAWRALGADAAQGFLLGRPARLPVAASSPILAK